MIKIGVIGSRGKTKVCSIIKDKLLKYNKKIIIVNGQIENIGEVSHIDCDTDIVIYIFYKEQYQIIKDKVKLDILIQTAFDDEDHQYFNMLQDIISLIKKDGYIIFDSDFSEKISFYCENIYPITYGLNSKSTVTASSIDDTDKLQFSYCLQRGIYTISNEIIKPFEKPFIESGSSDEILYYLAALTCILIIDYKF
ncbi:MAG TPA: hypothetical protein DD421_04565 [Clostridiaceae bacterium]|nr:hypothetical protein [Clostridiaceae bacterium]